MEDLMGQLETSVQARLDEDTDFQSSIADLSEEEKQQKIDERKSEEFNKELSALKGGSEEAKKAKEIADNYKIRAEKAEKALKEKGSTPVPSSEKDLGSKDVIYLAKADINEDDVDEVVEYAKKMGTSVQKAHDFYKPILEKREQERQTAAATQTKGGQRGKVESSDTVLRKAREGQLPESDADIESLVAAELEAKTKK